jgi:hypothetical protein
MNAWRENLSERQNKLRKRVTEAQDRVQEGLDFAFDRLLQERMDTYFIMEERLVEFERIFSEMIQEIGSTHETTSFIRLEERFNYLEDSFEEIDSELRGRPARRRRRFNLFDFFRQWQSEQENRSHSAGEINNAQEAYQILGLAVGADLRTVTASFRRMVKRLHPDTQKGDRSKEPQLRKLMAAYQFIKRDLKRS